MFVVEWRVDEADVWTDTCWSELESECDAYIMRRIIFGSPREYRVVWKKEWLLEEYNLPAYRDVNWERLDNAKY